jgi:hypothetical protein
VFSLKAKENGATRLFVGPFGLAEIMLCSKDQNMICVCR